MMKRSLLFTLGVTILSQTAFAGVVDIMRTVPNYDGKHSVCYVNPGTKATEGINVNEKVRLASTTKLLTAYWAISKLGADYRHTATIYFDPNTEEMHISNQRDPYFGERRMYHLVSELNKAGITKISKITFDRQFGLFRSIEQKELRATEITQNGGVKIEQIANNLKQFLNLNSWSRQMEANYIEVDQQAKKFKVDMLNQDVLRLSTEEVKFSEVNPLKNRPGVRILTSQSADMKSYLKIMNRYSLNYPADEIFTNLGGAEAYAKFMKEDLGITDKEMQIYVGSGLPNHSTGVRRDGWSTCESMVRVIAAMEQKLRKQGYDLTDVAMVAGEDAGTLGGFYGNADFDASVVAKTGTLGNAATLAGFINTNDGKVYFGIFFQTQAISTARAARDRAVIQIADSFSGPKSTGYEFKTDFLPFDQKSGIMETGTQATVGVN